MNIRAWLTPGQSSSKVCEGETFEWNPIVKVDKQIAHKNLLSAEIRFAMVRNPVQVQEDAICGSKGQHWKLGCHYQAWWRLYLA
jgi:hypothetical protein